MSKKWLVGLLILVLVLSAVTAVIAQDEADDDGTIHVDTRNFGRIAMFTDGRINATDLGAPVAIYHTEEMVTTPDGGQIAVTNGIELLAIEPETNHGRLVLDAGLDELEQLITGEVSSLESNGFHLSFQDGLFSVVAPPDFEGKVYNFQWEDTVIPVG